MIRDRVFRLLDRGFDALQPMTVQFSIGRTQFGISRRFPSAQGILWRPCLDEARRDPDLGLIRFLDGQGTLCGLIFTLACHPTAMGPDNRLLSADYPGAARHLLETDNPGLTAVFLQGCGADIKPRVSADGERFRGCTWDELEAGAASLTAEIEAMLLAGVWHDLKEPPVCRSSDFDLHCERWTRERWQGLLNQPDLADYRRQSIRRLLLNQEKGQDRSRLSMQMSCLDFGRNLAILGMEHEIVSEYGRKIKRLAGRPVFTLGYCKSSNAYIPTRKIQLEGGYENDSFIAAQLAGPFHAETEAIVTGQALDLLNPEPMA